MRRRCFCTSLALMPAVGGARTSAPGAVLLLRHARTEPGVGDPPGYVLGDCATQRNLSAEGRDQARALGEALAERGWRPSAIRSSRWCRCIDTAQAVAAALGGPAVEPWPALDSFFDDRSRAPAQIAQLETRWRERRRRDGFELWVTHQVNISGLTQVAPGMGGGLWLGRGERLTTSPLAL